MNSINLRFGDGYRFIVGLFLGTMFFLHACEKEKRLYQNLNNASQSYHVFNHPLKGKINSTEWDFDTGYLYRAYEEYYQVFLFNKSLKEKEGICDSWKSFNCDKVLFRTPYFPGYYYLGLQDGGLSVTFYDHQQKENHIVTEGVIQITALDSNWENATIRMNTWLDSTNYMSGSCTVHVCNSFDL